MDRKKAANNPEIFAQMKQLEHKKLTNTLEKRREQEKQRKLQMKNDAQERDGYIKEKIRSMEVYVQDLSRQVEEKRGMEKEEKEREVKESKDATFEEEFSRNRQWKDCLECFGSYPAEYISPIPEV